MSEMVERVAQAIGKAAVDDSRGKWTLDWPHLCDEDSNAAVDLRLIARAAIEAMREPTDEKFEHTCVMSDGTQLDQSQYDALVLNGEVVLGDGRKLGLFWMSQSDPGLSAARPVFSP